MIGFSINRASSLKLNNSEDSTSIMNKEVNLFKLVIVLVIEIASLFVFFLSLLYSDIPSGFESIFVLPLSFCLFPLALPAKRKDNRISLVNYIVIGLLFARNVVTPFFMLNETFNSTIGLATAENASKSILLVAYETIVVLFFVFYLEHKKYKKYDFQKTKKGSNLYFLVIISFLLIVSIVSFALIPEIRRNYYSIFNSNFNSWEQLDYSYRGNTFLRILGTLGGMSTEILRLIAPCFIMYALAKRKKNVFTFLLSCMLIGAQVFFMTDQNAYVLMVMISQWVYLTSLYPKYRKISNVILLALAILLFVIIYQYRFANTFFNKSFSMFLQAYIPGVSHTAGVFNVENNYSFLIWFNDVYCGLPFKSFLGLNSLQSYADLWKAANNGEAQIASMVSQSIFYFTSIGAPILSCFFIWCSKKIEYKINNKNPILKGTYIYLLIFMAAAPFVYNNCIFLNNFFQRIVFMILISKTYDYGASFNKKII